MALIKIDSIFPAINILKPDLSVFSSLVQPTQTQDLRGVQRGRGMHCAGCRGHAADDNPGYHAAPDLRGAELGCLL